MMARMNEPVAQPAAQPAAQDATEPARQYWILAGILVLSLAIRIALAMNVDAVEPRNDEREYLGLAAGILSRGEYLSLFRPPGMAAFIAGVIKLGADLETFRIVQSCMSVASVFLVWLITRVNISARTALWAAALVAFDPVQIGFSHLLWSETLFIFLMLAVMAVLLTPFEISSRWRWPVAGLLLGVAGLTRPVILSVAPLLVLIVFLVGRREAGSWSGIWPVRVRAMILMAVMAFAVVLPWTAHNYRVSNALILVDTNGTFNFLLGTDPAAMFHDKDDEWSQGWANVDGVPYPHMINADPVRIQRRALRIGAGYVASDPLRYLASTLFEGAQLWTLDNFPLRHLRNDWYGPDVPGWMIPLTVLSSAVLSALIIGLGWIGLLAMPRGNLRTGLLLLTLHSTILHTLLYALSRYQVPMRPLLAIGAACVLANPRACIDVLVSARRPTRRGWVALLIAVVLLVIWSRELPMLVDMLRTGGVNHRFVQLP